MHLRRQSKINIGLVQLICVLFLLVFRFRLIRFMLIVIFFIFCFIVLHNNGQITVGDGEAYFLLMLGLFVLSRVADNICPLGWWKIIVQGRRRQIFHSLRFLNGLKVLNIIFILMTMLFCMWFYRPEPRHDDLLAKLEYKAHCCFDW